MFLKTSPKSINTLAHATKLFLLFVTCSCLNEEPSLLAWSLHGMYVATLKYCDGHGLPQNWQEVPC